MTQTKNNSENESQPLRDLSSDNPLIDPKADRLGYTTFARYLADSICQMTFAKGFVIGVYGSLGSGKSTLLNFVTHYLEQKPKEEQPIIVPFNPWLFSGDEAITKRFFDQLQTVFSQSTSVPPGLKQRIADIAKVVSEIPLPFAQAGNAVTTLLDDEEKDTSDLKEEVEHKLRQKHSRIVVAIDDIDKLTADEIRQLFRVITAFPDFNNVVYLLVFDLEVVAKALDESQEVSGKVYLDKIIQAYFEIPLPDKTLLRRLMFEKLNAVFTDMPKQLFDQTYWGNVYQGIDHFINTPRDIVLLTNTLSVMYPVVKGEVNPVDFIAITSLRVFCPTIYDLVRKNPKAFAGSIDTTGFPGFGVDQLKSLHNSWMAQIKDEDREPIKRLLSCLFPKLEAVWGNTYYGAQQELIWREKLRICSLEVFPIYFRLTISEGNLSDIELKAILSVTKNAEAFGKSLIKLANQKCPDGTTQVKTFLERFEDYTEKEIPLDCISSIVQALFDVGDRLLRLEDEPCSMFDFGNDARIGRIVWQLLRRLEEPARFDVLHEAISNGDAISIIVRELVTLGEQQGKYGAVKPSPEAERKVARGVSPQANFPRERFISPHHFEELETLALKRVQAAAQQNSLRQTPIFQGVVDFWQQQTSQEEVQQWVQRVSDQEPSDFLEKEEKT